MVENFVDPIANSINAGCAIFVVNSKSVHAHGRWVFAALTTFASTLSMDEHTLSPHMFFLFKGSV